MHNWTELQILLFPFLCGVFAAVFGIWLGMLLGGYEGRAIVRTVKEHTIPMMFAIGIIDVALFAILRGWV